MSLVLFNLRVNEQAVSANEYENQLDNFLYQLMTEVNLAVNLRYAGNVDLRRSTGPGGEGFIRSLAFNRFRDLQANIYHPIIYFAGERETSKVSSIGGLNSNFGGVGFFFRPPSLNTPGEVRLKKSSTLPVNMTINDENEQIFTGISSIIIDEPKTTATGILLSVRISATVKYNLPTGNNRGLASAKMNWCPQRDMRVGTTGCNAGAPAGFLTKTATLYFSNNKGASSSGAFEFINGFYFFKPVFFGEN